MKVSTRVHYGLRAMTELARAHGEHRLVSIAEIARTECLPLAYLEQLVGELRRAGLVEGVRGVHGGYRLARPPAEMTVGHVYRVLEGEVAPVECTANDYHPGACAQDSACLSRSVWDRVQRAILQVLDSTTLADLMRAGALRPVAGSPSSFVPLGALAAPSSLSSLAEQSAGSLTHA